METIEYSSDKELDSDGSSSCTVEVIPVKNGYDEQVLKRLRKSLSGVPPPPSYTEPRLNLNELLDIWKTSASDFVMSKDTASDVKLRTDRAPYCAIKSVNDVLTYKWPDVLHCRYHDIYYNKGNISEEISDLYEKYRERWVHFETASFVTSNNSGQYDPSKIQEKKLNAAASKHVREYLSSRRIAFSVESLKSMSKQSTESYVKKHILVNKQYTGYLLLMSQFFNDQYEDFKRPIMFDFSQSNTNFKQADKIVHISKSRNNFNALLTKYHVTPTKHQSGMVNNSSYGLNEFDTADEKLRSTASLIPHTASSSLGIKSSRKTPRKRTPLKISKPAVNNEYKNSKSTILLQDDKPNGTSPSFTETQQKKLLWAVSSALKDLGINSRHENFIIYGQQLYKLCRRMWLLRNSDPSANIRGTSDKMYKIASEHVQYVIANVQVVHDERSKNSAMDNFATNDQTTAQNYQDSVFLMDSICN